jgi:hypothetical protein
VTDSLNNETNAVREKTNKIIYGILKLSDEEIRFIETDNSVLSERRRS